MMKVQPGDTVYLMAGVYYDTSVTTWGADSGTANNWITYTSYGDGEVILDATGSTNGWNGALWLDAIEYIRFSDITFRNSANYGILCESASGKTSNIIIDNCTFYNCSEAAMVFKGSTTNGVQTDITIENNTIYDVMNAWAGDDPPGQEVISLCLVADFEVQYNFLYNYRKAGIDAKSGCYRGKIHHNRFNTSRKIWGYPPWLAAGVYVDAGSTYCNNISIYCNVVWGNGTGFTIGTEKGGTLYNIEFCNNIYYGTQNAFQINDFTSASGSHLKTNCKFINNIAVGDVNICFQITDKDTSFKNFTVRNCIFEGKVGFNLPGGLKLRYHNVENNLYNILQYSNFYGANSINGTPGFVDPENNNYHLSSNSNAIDNGSPIDAPSFDYDGISRPQGTEVDIGAFEYLSTYGDNTPPVISSIIAVTSEPMDTDENYGWENFSCIVTDNVEVDSVLLKVTYPNNNHQNIIMTKKTGSNIYYSNRSFTQAGDYSYTIQATDTSNNIKTSSSNMLSLPPNWDVNNDGICNLIDLLLVSNHFGETGSNGWIREDFDNNGVVNILDINYISTYYDESW